MTAPAMRDIKVALFCGGRGSASIVRELLRWPNIRLTLLVNAYDDGLSTGALRDFIPGMLGPSDFRKNLSYLLDLYSAQQYALQRLIEYRLPRDVVGADIDALKRFARLGDLQDVRPPSHDMLAALDESIGPRIRALLAEFFAHAEKATKPFDYADCSFGNLIFAGAYLESGNFNMAANVMARLLGSRAELVNVSRGECRSLIGLKEDGSLLSSEAAIVGPQSPVPLRETFFFSDRPGTEQLTMIADRPVGEKEVWLKARETKVELSAEAERALREANIVIYGPGTQHSSLLPSYRIAAAALQSAPAALKVFVVNLHHDHDIQTLDATDLVDRALHYADDPENRHHVVTHILYNRASAQRPDGILLDDALLNGGTYRGAQVIASELENPVDPRVHSGHNIARMIIDLYENQGARLNSDTLEIYVDLLDRSLALEGLLQEFLEISWKGEFRHVALRINGLTVPRTTLPDYLSIESTQYAGAFSEVSVLVDWLNHGTSDYLITLTGDGEYRLRDVLLGINLLRSGAFGAVYGSRNQSRRQFRSSLNAAYGEGTLLFAASWLGAFVLTVLFSLYFRVIFSDPLTGFRIYRRSRLRGVFLDALQRRPPETASSVTKLLLRSGVEIAEIPVNYRTFTGFTQPSWRLWRGLRNLVGILR